MAIRGLTQEPVSRKWPGVQEALVDLARAEVGNGNYNGIDCIRYLTRYGVDGDKSLLVPLGVAYVTNVFTNSFEYISTYGHPESYVQNDYRNGVQSKES